MTDTEIQPRPRIKITAIVGALITIAVASTTLWVVTDPSHRADFLQWVLALTPGDFTLVAIAIGGAIALVAGLLAAIRSRQPH